MCSSERRALPDAAPAEATRPNGRGQARPDAAQPPAPAGAPLPAAALPAAAPAGPDRPAPSRRGAFAFLIRVLIFAVVFVGIGELWFRVVTPATETPNYYHDSEWKLMRYDPSGPTEGLWTVGRLAARGGHWRVNNDGWISAIDYVPAAERERPLVAVVGDSYIEGFLTEPDQHVDAYLADALGGKADVYAFAMSAWYLEQYVALSRYVSAVYAPDVLLVFLGEGDVAQSLRDGGPVYPDLWQIGVSDTGFAEIPPVDLSSTGRLKRMAKLSAVANYLLFNAKIQLPGMADAKPLEAGQQVAAGEQPGAPAETDASPDLSAAARYMVNKLRADSPGVPIVFVARGDRYLPTEVVAQTPLDADALLVQQACQDLPNCYFLDLRPAFSADWAGNHVRFEAADGAHWNAYANRLVAQALAAFVEEKALFAD